MTKSEFIAYKIPILIKEGYSKAQAAAISYNLYNKEQQKAQQGAVIDNTYVPKPRMLPKNAPKRELSQGDLEALSHQLRGMGSGINTYVKKPGGIMNDLGNLTPQQIEEVQSYMKGSNPIDSFYQLLPNANRLFGDGYSAADLPSDSKLRGQYQQGGEKQYAQQARFNQTVPNYNFTVPSINQLPNQGYDFSYNGFNPQPIQNNTQFGQPSMFSNYTVPEQPLQPIQSFQSYNQAQNIQDAYNNSHNPNDYIQGDANGDGVVDAKDKAKKQYITNSVNIVDPTEGFGNPMYNLNRGMYNFGRGNTLGGIAGTGAALFGLARTGLLGYSQGKEDRRIGQEYNEKRFDRTPNYAMGQQGGQIENKMYQTGNSNVIAEHKEIVLQDGQVSEVHGKPHLDKDGNNIGGTGINVKEGAKIVSNAVMPTQKITDRDKAVIDDVYGIKVKKGITHADAVRELLKPLSIKKENNQLADLAEKLKKANKIKDRDTRDLSVLSLQKQYSQIKSKVGVIEQERAERTNFVFENIQEPKPKQGDGTQLFDKNGKEVTESNEGVAQQGKMINQNDVNRINQNPYMEFTPEFAKQYFEREEINNNGQNPNRTIRSIQGGVSNDKYGDGKYIYYDKLPTEQGFNVNKNREFVTQEAYTNNVLNSPAYQAYMRGQNTDKRVAGMQQGGSFESIAQKYGISPERARELVMMQSGGEMPQEEEAQQDQMQQVFQAVAEMLQQGAQPEQVAEQLIQMGVPEEQVGQIIQEVAQQMQGQSQQEEQMEGQYSNEQEEGMEMAQQGGQKRYAQQAVVPETYEQKMARIIAENVKKGTNAAAPGLWSGSTAEEFYNPYTNWEKYLGRTPREIKAHETYQKGITADLNPQISKLITTGEMPLTNKHRQLLKQAGVKNADKIISYTELSEADRKKVGDKFVINGYNDTYAGHRGVVVQPGDITQEEYNKLTGEYDKLTDEDGRQIYAQYENGKLKRDAKGDFVFYYPKKAGEPEKPVDPSKITEETKKAVAEQPNQEVEAVNNVKNIPAIFPAFIPPYSPMQAIGKESAFLPRYESYYRTPEAKLKEQAAQALNQQYAIEQTGISPQQQQSVLGRNLYQSQMAANDAISEVEQFNANNQWQTDNLNTGIRAKEDIMNSQYRQDYQNKVMQTLANKETQDYNNYYSNFMQDQANSNKIINMNTANALNDQWAITPQGVIPLNNKPYEFKNDYASLEDFYKNKTPEEIFAFKKMMGAKGIKV